MSTLRSNRSFVRLFLGRLVTNGGDSLYFVGSMWLVHELTGSALYTGIAGAMVQLPKAVQFLYGPLVDRWDLRRVLVRTQVVQGLFVLVIPLAAVTGHLSVWLVLGVMPVLAFINEIVYPAQTAALPQIVEDDQLVRANSLFSTAYQGVEAVFNALGGIVLAVLGATALFLLDSVTFAIAAALFFGVKVSGTGADDDESADEYLDNLRAGFDYLRGSIMLPMMAGAAIVNFGSGAMLAVLPSFADSIGGAGTYGILMAAIAGGPLAGAVASVAVEDRSYGLVSIVGFVASGVSFFAAVTVPGVPATTAFFFLAHIPIGTFNVMFSSTIQSSVDETFLGRVSSVLNSVSMAMLPVGTLLGGALGELFTPELVITGLAVLMALFAGYFLVHPDIRSLPAVDEIDEATLGLQSS